VSQLLTLYTTPVVYLSLDRLRLRWSRSARSRREGPGGPGGAPGGRLAHPLRLLALVAAAALLAGCAAAPEYARPAIAVPPEYKEVQPTGVWQPAQPDVPAAAVSWEVFDDPVLESLVADVDLSNQNLRIAEAQLRGARAAVAAARAALYPSVSAGASASRGRSTTGMTNDVYGVDVGASWEVDLWGRVRASVAAAQSGAEASAAELAAARLSAHALLAQSYFQLRVADAQRRLLGETVASYQRSLQLTRDRLAAGVATRADVAQAEAQLKTVEAQRMDVGIARAQLEHAIALLTGRAPSSFALDERPLPEAVPPIPPGLPSRLLERRPDIAAAERQVAAANARIGIARAAYFPSLTLSADVGLRSNRFGDLFSLPSRVWSLGPALAALIFDAGAREAATEQALADYDATVAAYRQTVLQAFQEVEDNLVALRVLADEEGVQREVVAAARISLDIVTLQYKAGTVSYLNVIQAQTTVLQGEQALLSLHGRRLVATVALLRAIGGDW